MFMFQGKRQKKKLWLACQKKFQQYNQDTDVMPSVQPQQRHLQLPHRPQQQLSMVDEQDLPPPSYGQMKCSGKCCCSMRSMLENSEKNNNNNNSSSNNQPLLYPMNITQSVCSNNCFGDEVDVPSYPMEMESGSEEMSIEQDCEFRTGGCYSESCGDNSTDCNEGDDYDHRYSSCLPAATRVTTEELMAERQMSWQQAQILSFHQTPTLKNSKSNAMTAGNVLRNCYCACGESVSNESSVGDCHQQQNQNYSLNNNNVMAATAARAATAAYSTVTSVITTTTTSVFRHCCRGSVSNESSIGIYPPYPQNNLNLTLNYNINNNNNNAIGINKNNYNFYEQRTTTTTNNSSSDISRVKEQCKSLIKKLSDSQLNTLCQVVESRCGTDANNDGVGGVSKNQRAHQLSPCILVKREPILGEEPNVMACRLWLWPDLKTTMELKRIPMCPNGRETFYVCCNPAHWNRILIPDRAPSENGGLSTISGTTTTDLRVPSFTTNGEETAPPPYQQSDMDRLKPEDRAPSENSKDGGLSTVSGTTTTGLRVQIPESFTTNGEDHSMSSLTWCEIAYWELAQRVGERYEAKNSTINIYSEGSDGMCLKDLAEKNQQKATSSFVEKTRQKIGLGITLSQEADGVWLYNRSEAPIFIHSPTLNDDCRHVSKVPPGYCLNAFDKNRARTQKPQIAGAQTGPLDTFSMQISFAKGWGSKYRRTDITACHCWLEVLFSRR